MRNMIQNLAREYREKANNCPNQTSYDAGWLHGYATALERLLDALDKQQETIAGVDAKKN